MCELNKILIGIICLLLILPSAVSVFAQELPEKFIDEPLLEQPELFKPEPGCSEMWVCTQWSECTADGFQTRACADQNDCGSMEEKPRETRPCTYTHPADITGEFFVDPVTISLAVLMVWAAIVILYWRIKHRVLGHRPGYIKQSYFQLLIQHLSPDLLHK